MNRKSLGEVAIDALYLFGAGLSLGTGIAVGVFLFWLLLGALA